MAFPSSTSPNLSVALSNLQNYAAGIKSTATADELVLASGPVTTAWVFNLLDQLTGVVNNLNSYSAIAAALSTYADTAIPNYSGNLTNDGAAIITAAQAVISWVFTNTTGVQWYTLNADGTRTMASFTPTQTVGLRTALNNLVATIN